MFASIWLRETADGSVFLKVNQYDAILAVLGIVAATFVVGAVVGLLFGTLTGSSNANSKVAPRYLRPRRT